MLTTYLTTVFLAFIYVSTVFVSCGREFNPVLEPILNPDISPCLQPQPYRQCIDYPTSGSIFYLAPSVVKFTNAVFLAIFNSAILSELFDFSQTTAMQYQQFVYKYNIDFYKSTLDFKSASAIAEFASRAIGRYFYVLTTPVVARTVCSTAADYLLFEGILKVDNSEDIAMAYVETIKYHARVNMTADPTSKFKVVADSFFDFMMSIDPNAKDTIPISTYCYGLEWFESAVLYNCLDQ